MKMFGALPAYFGGKRRLIGAIFKDLPATLEEGVAAAYAGQTKRGWYEQSARTILEIFGIEDAPRFSALLAALSPQQAVARLVDFQQVVQDERLHDDSRRRKVNQPDPNRATVP